MNENKCQVIQHVPENTSKSSDMTLSTCNDINLSSEFISSINNTDINGTVDSPVNVNVNNVESNNEAPSESIVLKNSIETSNECKIPRATPSLDDDSRLVKFSLPSNSINLIQSNTQFLNKSRLFINFITEKSTNIMEKALLPQHLAIRNHNSNTKILELDGNSSYFESDTVNVNSIIPTMSDVEELIIECSDNSEKVELSQNNLQNDININSNGSINSDCFNDVNKEISVDNQLQIDEISKLKKQIDELEAHNKELELLSSLSEIESRDKTIQRLTQELRGAIINQEEMRKECMGANKERENMVMKYAVGEKQLIESQKARDCAERKIKELSKDNDMLQNKLKQVLGERTRICGVLDVKCRELADAQKEIEKFKEEIEMKEIKLKWTQNKLKSEMETYQENTQKLEKAMVQINEMKDEYDQIRRESQETIRKFQQSELNKTATLEQQLKEQQAQLILERHLTEDKELSRLQLQKEVEMLKNRQYNLVDENNSLSLKIQDVGKDQSTYECNINQLKIIVDEKQKEIVDLNNKLTHLETLKLQLIHKDQCLIANETELDRLRRVNQELQTEMELCRQRENHMLDFTQKLTDKNVRLQSEFSAIESKSNQLEVEQGPLRQNFNELEKKLKIVQNNLTIEKNKRIEECEILAKHVAEQTQLAQNLTQMLEDSKGENCVLRRKYQLSMKEMTRELQQCRKKLESFESASTNNLLGQTSRASSDTSLNAADTSQYGVSLQCDTPEQSMLSNDLDKNSLIEKILKMQRINVRRAEKLDFLEEHTRALVIELQRKTKIIQNYILHENFDAMGNNDRDKYKHLKSRRDTAELVRHGGIMASVYNQRVSDENMTLELSLEINQKLQAVLEDALLKNITLKDNIDTLGEEIARLSIQNQQFQKTKK